MADDPELAPVDVPATRVEDAPAENTPVEDEISGDVSSGDLGGYWPDDWRARLAGDDDKSLKQLERFTDPGQLWKKIVNQEKVIRSRREALSDVPDPETATPDEINEWRTQHGVPTDPQGYVDNLKLSDGRVIGDADKPIVNRWAEAIHGTNAPQEFVDKAIDTYLQLEEERVAEQALSDEEFREGQRHALRESWGSEMRKNFALMNQLFNDSPEVKELIYAARGPDGQILGNNSAVIQFLTNMAYEVYGPQATVTGSTVASADSIDEEIATLEKLSAKQDSEYWHGPTANKNQSRFAELLEVKAKMEEHAQRRASA